MSESAGSTVIAAPSPSTKVLVTVGTTPFPSLVCFFDRPAPGCDVVIQSADPSYSLRHARGFAFSDDLQDWYAWANVVVAHAGAGTVYQLLEQRRRVVVIPNLERADKHQRDLASHVAMHRYAMVVDRLERFGGVEPLISSALRFEAAPYQKTEFFKADFLVALVVGDASSRESLARSLRTYDRPSRRLLGLLTRISDRSRAGARSHGHGDGSAADGAGTPDRGRGVRELPASMEPSPSVVADAARPGRRTGARSPVNEPRGDRPAEPHGVADSVNSL